MGKNPYIFRDRWYTVRCRYYDDDGNPVGQCPGPGTVCKFAHPGHAEWDRAERRDMVDPDDDDEEEEEEDNGYSGWGYGNSYGDPDEEDEEEEDEEEDEEDEYEWYSVKCLHYDDDGVPASECPRATYKCKFAHPDQEEWATAIRRRGPRKPKHRPPRPTYDRPAPPPPLRFYPDEDDPFETRVAHGDHTPIPPTQGNFSAHQPTHWPTQRTPFTPYSASGCGASMASIHAAHNDPTFRDDEALNDALYGDVIWDGTPLDAEEQIFGPSTSTSDSVASTSALPPTSSRPAKEPMPLYLEQIISGIVPGPQTTRQSSANPTATSGAAAPTAQPSAPRPLTTDIVNSQTSTATSAAAKPKATKSRTSSSLAADATTPTSPRGKTLRRILRPYPHPLPTFSTPAEKHIEITRAFLRCARLHSAYAEASDVYKRWQKARARDIYAHCSAAARRRIEGVSRRYKEKKEQARSEWEMGESHLIALQSANVGPLQGMSGVDHERDAERVRQWAGEVETSLNNVRAFAQENAEEALRVPQSACTEEAHGELKSEAPMLDEDSSDALDEAYLAILRQTESLEDDLERFSEHIGTDFVQREAAVLADAAVGDLDSHCASMQATLQEHIDNCLDASTADTAQHLQSSALLLGAQTKEAGSAAERVMANGSVIERLRAQVASNWEVVNKYERLKAECEADSRAIESLERKMASVMRETPPAQGKAGITQMPSQQSVGSLQRDGISWPEDGILLPALFAVVERTVTDILEKELRVALGDMRRNASGFGKALALQMETPLRRAEEVLGRVREGACLKRED